MLRAALVLLTTASLGLAFAACGGKVSIEPGGDAGLDAQPTPTPTPTSTPTAIPTGTPTTTPPGCPTYRPISKTPCSIGLSCFYPCAAGQPSAIQAACPSGQWVLREVERCDEPPPPPMDCETCQNTRCAAESKACEVEPAYTGCMALINCLNSCVDTACQNACIVESMSTEGKLLLQCVVDKCIDACSG